MRSIIILMSFLLVYGSSFAQNVSSSDTTKKNQKNTAAGKTPKQAPQQAVHITPGASGVKRSIGYKFSSLYQESDPGSGRFRYNNQSISSVKYIYADDSDISGEDQSNWYSTWDKTTGAAGRGRVTVTDQSGKVVTVFDFTGVFSDMNGFWKLPVRYVSGNMPSDGVVCYYVFERIAHDEPSGSGNQGNQPDPAPQVATAVVTTVAAVQPPVTTQTSDARSTQAQQASQTGTTPQTKPVTTQTQKEQPPQNVTQANTVVTKPQTTQQVQKTQANNATQGSQITTTSTGTYWVGNSQATTSGQPARTTPSNQSLYSGSYGAQNNGGVRRKWYSGIIEAGYGFGLGNYGQNNFKFNFINGFRIGKFSSLGLGIGYRHLFTANKTETYTPVAYQYIPVFIDFRTTFTSKSLTPYMAVGFGSSAATDDSETSKDGLLFNASGGVWYNVSKRFVVFGGIVYEMMKLEFSDLSPENNLYQKNANSLGINIGISF